MKAMQRPSQLPVIHDFDQCESDEELAGESELKEDSGDGHHDCSSNERRKLYDSE